MIHILINNLKKSNEIDNHYASMMASLQKEKDQKVNSLMISMTLRISEKVRELKSQTLKEYIKKLQTIIGDNVPK